VGAKDDLAYEMGAYTLTIQPEGGQAQTDTGKYVVVWTRQADGSWKLAVDIWNSNAPPPAQ
ncbi:MAG: YybH family protein, partial [Candidatus Methylomirabilales bacterium]